MSNNFNITNIGYWYSVYEPQYPMPEQNSASDSEIKLQLDMLDLFEDGAQDIRYKGYSKCRICGCRNGTSEFHKTIDGNNFAIPIGLRHYIKDHRVLVKHLMIFLKVVDDVNGKSHLRKTIA